MPHLACWTCGRRIYTVAPLSSLFAEERRCPRCGAYPPGGPSRRRAPDGASGARTRQRPGTADPRPRTEGRRRRRRRTRTAPRNRRAPRDRPPDGSASRRPHGAAARRGHRLRRLAGLTDRSAHRPAAAAAILADMHDRLPRLRPDRRLDRARRPCQPRDDRLDDGRLVAVGRGPRKAAADGVIDAAAAKRRVASCVTPTSSSWPARRRRALR